MYSQEVSFPQEVSIEMEGLKVKVSGPKGSLEKEFRTGLNIKIEKKENTIIVSSESERRDSKSIVGTVNAHIGNMIEGVTKGFVYKLKVVYAHFPITVKVEGNKLLIQNFIGERSPRTADIIGNTKVEVNGPEITVSGISKDDVGQTAANMEQATRIHGYDKKVFMDGIYLVSRG